MATKAKEDEIRDWLGPAGDIKGLRLNRDKAGTVRMWGRWSEMEW